MKLKKELQELVDYFASMGHTAKVDELENYYEGCDGPCVVLAGWVTSHGHDGYMTDSPGSKNILVNALTPKEVLDFILEPSNR